MSTGKTKNIQLNQWEPQDDFLRAEFNEDNQKIDAAVQSANDAIQETNMAMAELNAAIQTADAAIQETNTVITGLSTAIQKTNAVVAGLNTAIQTADAAIQSLDARVQTLNTAVQDSGYVTLLDVTTASDAAQVDLDLSGIDFTQFWKVELFMKCSVSDSLYIRAGGVSTGYYIFTHGNSSTVPQTYLNYFYQPGTRAYYSTFSQPTAGLPIVMSTESFYHNGSDGGNSHCYGVSTVTWDALTSFNFHCSSGNVPAGTRFALKGVKR